MNIITNYTIQSDFYTPIFKTIGGLMTDILGEGALSTPGDFRHKQEPNGSMVPCLCEYWDQPIWSYCCWNFAKCTKYMFFDLQ